MLAKSKKNEGWEGNTIQREICEMMIGQELGRLHRLGYDLVIGASEVESLMREGFHRTLGARPLRNTVETFLQDAAKKLVLLDALP